MIVKRLQCDLCGRVDPEVKGREINGLRAAAARAGWARYHDGRGMVDACPTCLAAMPDPKPVDRWFGPQARPRPAE